MRSLRFAIPLIFAAASAVSQERATTASPTFSERVEVRVLDLAVDVADSKVQTVPDL